VTLAAIWRSRKFNQQKVAWRPECAMVVAAQHGGFLGDRPRRVAALPCSLVNQEASVGTLFACEMFTRLGLDGTLSKCGFFGSWESLARAIPGGGLTQPRTLRKESKLHRREGLRCFALQHPMGDE
jgi:hypothetical protein